MPAKRPPLVRTRDRLADVSADTPEGLSRTVDELSRQVLRLEPTPRSAVQVDLRVGSNRVVHNLGRKPRGATVTPTVADATFAWALTSADERTAVIAVAGIAQDRAWLEFY